MDAMIVNVTVDFILGRQRGVENGRAIARSRVVLGVGVFIDEIIELLEVPIDEHDINKGSN